MSESDIVIEPMRWWHVERVAELERDLFPSDGWSVEQFWQELAQSTRTYVVAARSGEVVGYAGAFILPPDSDVQTIAVQSARQGQGIGVRLLDALMTAARDSGSSHLMLEVRSDSLAAISLYRRRGFEVISTRPRYYSDGGDALIMRCRLGAAT